MKSLIYILIFTSAILAQSDDSLSLPLIRVGDRAVSMGEFLERYELTPQEGKQSKGNQMTKMLNFAYTLIAEKLWAKEAGMLRLDTTEAIQISADAFEKMFIRDALYKRLIRDKVEITAYEMKEGMIRNSKKLYVNYLFSEDKDEIFKLHNLLTMGVPFDSILAESPEADEQKSPVEIVYGQMDPIVEDSLYKLKLNQFTVPIITPDGWYIFKLVNKQEQAGIFFDPDHESYKNTERIIRLRKEKVLYTQFFAKFFSGKNINASFEPLKKLASAISEVVTGRIKAEKINLNKPYQLDAFDILAIKDKLSSSALKAHIVNIEGKDITVNQFLLESAFNGLSFRNPFAESVFKDLNKIMRKFIESELLALEGKKMGLHLDPEVQKEFSVWKENYMFQALESKFRDSVSVSEEEARKEYERIFQEKHYPSQLNLYRIYCRTPEIADTIMRRLKSGLPIEQVYEKLKAEQTGEVRGGESGYFWVNEFGEAGEIAFRLDVGETYGPMKQGAEYLVFKLLGKKSEMVELPEKTFEEVKEKLKSEIAFRKLKNKMTQYTVNLAVKYGFSVDMNLMEKLNPTGINSFAVRSLGFGGSTPAVPLLAPNYEWIFLYLDKIQKMNP